MKTLLLSALLLATALRAADPAPLPVPKMEKFRAWPGEDDIGYREAVRVGNTLYISGAVGAGDMPSAIKEIYDNLGKTLKHFGLTFDHVVKENVYTLDIEALKANLDKRKAYYGTNFPAATWVQVARLYDASHILEVELIAVFPE